jgi:hypothetical protein
MVRMASARTLAQLLDRTPPIVSRVRVRCGVCRFRDWERGGDGRSDFVAEGIRQGGRWLVSAHRRARVEVAGRSVVGPFVLSPATADGWRWRCRRGHRLRWDGELVDRERGRGALDVWLPAA